jgi:phenylacetate-CoA ligase
MILLKNRHNLSHIRIYINLFRSAKSLEKGQGKHLRKLVAHAYEHVPLWRDMYSRLGVSPEEVTGIEDLKKLPITDKHTYRGKMYEECLDNSDLNFGVWRFTSGSTGHPFSVLTSKHRTCQFCVNILRSRFLIWNGTLPHRLRDMRIAQIQTTPERTLTRLTIALDRYRENPAAVIEEIVSFRPQVLETYAALIFDFARVIEASGRADVNIPYVITYGEMLRPAMREYIERILKCEVYDRYGLEEMGVLAVECKQHHGLHTYNDFFIFEIVDEKGEPVPPGVSGRIIVTDLYNYNMPFIRYDTGDKGKMLPGPCPCGVSLPRLLIDGRESVFLSFGSRNVHQFELDEAIIHISGDIFQFQFVKKSDSELLIRIIPGETFAQKTIPDIRTAIQAIAGNSVDVHVELVHDIKRTARGKMPIVLDES